MAGTKKLTKWQAQEKPDENACEAIRQLVVEAVMAKWNTDHKPSTLLTIFYRVQDRIKDLKAIGKWPWKIPGKRTIDRRVNEAADPRFYENRRPKIVAVTAGLYRPNPKLFSEGKVGPHKILSLKAGQTGLGSASKLVEVGVWSVAPPAAGPFYRDD